MKWKVVRRKKKIKTKNQDVALNSWLFKSKEKNLLINNQTLIDQLCLGIINEFLDELLTRIVNYLASEEDDAETTSLLYDELAKQRSFILQEYEAFLSPWAVQMYMKKLRFAAFELKKRLKSYNYQRRSVKVR